MTQESPTLAGIERPPDCMAVRPHGIDGRAPTDLTRPLSQPAPQREHVARGHVVQPNRRRLKCAMRAGHLSAPRETPMIVAGDFNDWRHSASGAMFRRLGLEEVSVMHNGKPARTFPSLLPVLRLDRIYVRGFEVLGAQSHRGAPWRLLSDHLALSAELSYVHGAEVRTG